MKRRDGFTGYREMEDFQTLVIVKNRNGTLLTLNYGNQDTPDIDIYRNKDRLIVKYGNGKT